MFLDFIQAIESLQYLYMFLSLLGIFIIVTRKKMTLENELTTHISEKHPEQKARRATNIRLYFVQMTLSILMALVATAGIFSHAFKGIDLGANVVYTEAQYNWDSKSIQKSFVTLSRFKDASLIEITYNLNIHLPNGFQLSNLKFNYRTIERLLDSYIKPYLHVISNETCASYTTKEFQTNKNEFANFLRNQISNGMLHPSLGVSSVDIGQSPKSYGIKFVVNTIEYSFEDLSATTDELKNVKKKIDTAMEDWIKEKK